MRYMAFLLLVAFPLFAAEVPGACRTDDAAFNTEEGGCLQFKTGLVWSSAPKGKFKYASAAGYCRSLDEGGLSDWRLPKRGELQAMGSDRAWVAHLNAKPVAFFWAESSTSGGQAWAVSLADGETGELEANEAAGSAICVRTPADVDGDGIPDSSDKCNMTPRDSKEVHTTGQWKGCAAGDNVIAANEVRRIGCAKESAYFTTADGGCKHTATGLVWSARGPVALGFEHARGYCSDLREGLKNDWRLPTEEELKRLAGALRASPSFKFPTSDPVWSDTTRSSRALSQGYVLISFYRTTVALDSGASAYDHHVTEKHYCCPDKGSEGNSFSPERLHPVLCVRQ